jgi:predicted Fe-Mo cluster-binding NifX family protein
MQMKIAVASDDGKTITGHVGKCEMFIVFDIIDKEIINVEKRLNSFTMHKTENHNHEHHNHENHEPNRHVGIINGLKDCNYLFCCSGGHGLIDDLFSSGVQTILTEEMEADKAVKLFLDGKLESDPNKKCKEHHN